MYSHIYAIGKVLHEIGLPVIGLGDFTDIRSREPTPKEMFGNLDGWAAVIGNHDYETWKRFPNEKKVRKKFYRVEITKKGMRYFKRNGFGIRGLEDIIEEKDVRIFKMESKKAEVYFLHIPPIDSVVRELAENSTKRNMIIFTGHIHGLKKVRINNEYRYGKNIEIINIPTYRDNKKVYEIELTENSFKMKEIKIEIEDKEATYQEKEINSGEVIKVGRGHVYYIT